VNIDTYDTPEAETLLRVGESRKARRLDQRRQLITQMVAAAGFLLAAGLLAATASWHRPLEPLNLVLVIGTFVIVERVRFPVADSWTYPTMLSFVPLLFVIPTPLAPLVVMVGILLGGVPRFVRDPETLSRVPADIADAWYTIGPTLVIVLFGAERFSWSHWPVYALALMAQVLFDLLATIGRCSIGEGIEPSVQLPLLTWIYITDALLAAVGLLIGASAATRPGLVLLALAPLGLLALFARERQQRLDQTLLLSSAYRGTALLLGEVVEADDRYTGIHSRQVVDLAASVADTLGLDSATRRNVEFTALLHDVGKIHVPKRILNKPGPLDDAEWKILHQHTIDGERMLTQVGGALAGVGRLVRASHERYDGGGYPDGLAGEEIPIEARIVAVCDAFSAMTTDRPYRAAMPVRYALAELQHCASSQFDPAVVRALIETVERELSVPRTHQHAAGTDRPGTAAVLMEPSEPAGVLLDPDYPDDAPARRRPLVDQLASAR
jgi:HD-GYP domain-containing protein (c-di-GMP phosphodiesterase class II)